MRLVALALAFALLAAAPPQPAAAISVPIVAIGDHLFTEVRLNGSAPLRFAIDTAGGQIVDTAVATRLGLPKRRAIRLHGVGDASEPGWTTRVAQVRIGDAELDDLPFVAMPIATGFGIAEGGTVDGVIGPALLARFTVTIDVAHATMTLAPKGSGPLGEIPLVRNDDGHPAVPCRIEDVDTRCQLDTGSRLAVTLLRPFLLRHPSIAARPQTAEGVDGYGIGGPARGRLGYVDLTLGGRTLHVVADYTAQRRGAFTSDDVGGNIGERVLARFIVTFDLARGRARLVPTAAADEPDRVDRSGLFLVRRDGVTMILDVRAATPAARAGLRAGDTIVSVDGRPADALSLVEIRALLSDPRASAIALRVRDTDDREREVALALADYVPSAAEATASTAPAATGSAGSL